MAGEWIKMRIDLTDDPAVIGIACRLDCSEYEVVGRLHKIWSWADRHTEDGHAPSVTRAWLDRYVERDGFAEAMELAGWLSIGDAGLSFPNFDRHNGQSAKKRGLAADRKRKQRDSVTHESREVSRIERDACVTREEKRREEVKTPCSPPSGDLPQWKTKRFHEAVIAKYHEFCPELPSVRTEFWKGERQKNLNARLAEYPPARELDWWDKFFGYVATIDLLMGRLPPKPGQQDSWNADLGWLVKPENFRKVVENTYTQRGAA